jgi:hypothetical protein
MARPSKFRESKGAWYVNVKGKQTALGVKGQDNEVEAVKAWHRLMAGMPPRNRLRLSATFATDVLARGVPDAQVAAPMGHSGTAMLHRRYSHLTAHSQALRHALGRLQ